MKNTFEEDFNSNVFYYKSLWHLDIIFILIFCKYYEEFIERCGEERDSQGLFRYLFKKDINSYITECKLKNQVNNDVLNKFEILSEKAFDRAIEVINCGYNDNSLICGEFLFTHLKTLCIPFSKFLDEWLKYPTDSFVKMYVKIRSLFSNILIDYPDFGAKYKIWKRKIIYEKWEENCVDSFKDIFGIIYVNNGQVGEFIPETANYLYEDLKAGQEDIEQAFWIYFLFYERVNGKIFYNFIHLLVHLSHSQNVPYIWTNFAHDMLRDLLKDNPYLTETIEHCYNVSTRDIKYLLNEKSQEIKSIINLINTSIGYNNSDLSNKMLSSPKLNILRRSNNTDNILYIVDNRLAMKVYEFLSDNEVFKVDNIDLTNFILFIQSADFKYLGNKEIEEIVKKNIFGRTCCSIKDYVIIGDDDIKVGWLNKVASQLYHTQKKPIHLCKSPSNPSKEKLKRLFALEKEMKKEYNKIYS